jgi:tetratricopeptide (TPR) repeat protein
MLLTLAPSNQLVLLLAACHLQLGENLRAAELLETLAVRDPKSATTWSQLQSIYLSAAADTKKPDEARSLNLRALHTIERAQANGHLSTPRDNYTRVAILFNIQQFARAAALLEKGLADGSIEGVKRNWELLASAYQQIDKNQKALEALANATAKFPDDGALEFSLAQFLYNTGNPADAYVRGQSALAKGVEKRGQTEVYLAYLAYELQRYEEALKWVDAARASGDVPATTLDPLATAIADALRNREAAART